MCEQWSGLILIARGLIQKVTEDIYSWLERTPDKREVDGSSPFRPINNFVIIREIINLDDGEVLKRLKRRPC